MTQVSETEGGLPPDQSAVAAVDPSTTTATTEVVVGGEGTDTPAAVSEASVADPVGHRTTIRVAPPVVSEPGFQGRRFSVFTVHGAVVHEAETHDAQIGVALSPGLYHVYVNNVAGDSEERFGKPVNKEITITGEGVEDFLIE